MLKVLSNEEAKIFIGLASLSPALTPKGCSSTAQPILTSEKRESAAPAHQ
jgi:hypothetical protein